MPSAKAYLARQLYKFKGEGKQSKNPVVLLGEDIKTNDGFRYDDVGYSYTPYDSKCRWMSMKYMFGYLSDGYVGYFIESDYWSSPRFQSLTYGNATLQAGTTYHLYKSDGKFYIDNAVSGYNVASFSGDVKRIFALMCGGGGGGGGGSYSYYYQALYDTGGGGGGGACGIVAIDISGNDITSSNPLVLYVGSGGAYGASDAYDGGDGGDTTIKFDGSTLCEFGGGKGGKAGKRDASTHAHIGGGGGAGGEFNNLSKNVLIYELDGYGRTRSYYGGKGGDGKGFTGYAFYEGNAGEGLATQTYFSCYSSQPSGTSLAANYDSVRFPATDGGSTSYVYGTDVAVLSGGGASHLSPGGTGGQSGSDWKPTSAGYGAGGRGGGWPVSVSQTYKVYSDAGRGGDGVICLWWPQPIDGAIEATLQKPNLSLNQSSSTGSIQIVTYFAQLGNPNDCSVTCYYGTNSSMTSKTTIAGYATVKLLGMYLKNSTVYAKFVFADGSESATVYATTAGGGTVTPLA